jgi:asparagine synthase (glutamine-hydrolysing)
MCGIAGFLYFSGRSPDNAASLLYGMSDLMKHRGPDGQGIFQQDGVGLVHRRLAIIDLQTGNQPMASGDGRLQVIFNGEIYNHGELRGQLTSYPFRTRSDTEVLLAAYDRWGLDFPKVLNGIFSFALWDSARRRLLLVRDPFGVKPLHIHINRDRMAFASEIKSLLWLPDVRAEVDCQALHDFMNVRYVPGTNTLFEGISRLQPGHALVAGEYGTRVRKYFHFEPQVESDVGEGEWCERIVSAVKSAVSRQLMSDVPLGVYLSGGIDSSTLVAMMHALGVPEIQTFSLGFNEPTDELQDAAIVAEHFRTNHFPSVIGPEPLRFMEKVLWHVEEPQVNMLQGFTMAGHAAKQVKVVLGGLGGDELFAGYVTSLYLKQSLWGHRLTPKWLQDCVLSPLSRSAYHLGSRFDLRWEEYRRGIQLLCAAGVPERFYAILRNVWDHDTEVGGLLYGERMNSRERLPVVRHFDPYFRHGLHSDIVTDSLWLELNTKMIDDFLLSEDRVSMAHGLESRVPFLDLDLVKLAFSIPVKLKMRGSETKSLFRKAVSPYLPAPILKKKKWGFTFNPYLQFQKDLKTAVQERLTRQAVKELGFFNYEFIEKILKHPPHPRLRWHYFIIWVMLGFHEWYDIFIKKSGFRNDISGGCRPTTGRDAWRLSAGIVEEGGICSLDGS